MRGFSNPTVICNPCWTNKLMSKEILMYTSIEGAADFWSKIQSHYTVDGHGAKTGNYAEKAPPEILGKVGILIFKKAIDDDRQV